MTDKELEERMHELEDAIEMTAKSIKVMSETLLTHDHVLEDLIMSLEVVTSRYKESFT